MNLSEKGMEMTGSKMEWTKPDVNGQTPTIKNHTSTLVGNQLLVFGGYDGIRVA